MFLSITAASDRHLLPQAQNPIQRRKKNQAMSLRRAVQLDQDDYQET